MQPAHHGNAATPQRRTPDTKSIPRTLLEGLTGHRGTAHKRACHTTLLSTTCPSVYWCTTLPYAIHFLHSVRHRELPQPACCIDLPAARHNLITALALFGLVGDFVKRPPVHAARLFAHSRQPIIAYLHTESGECVCARPHECMESRVSLRATHKQALLSA